MMIGIVIGIAAVTLVISIGLGAEKRVINRVKKFGVESIMIFSGGGRETGHPASGDVVSTLKLEDAEVIEQQVPGVKETAPFNRKGDSMVKYQEKSFSVRLFGVTPSWEQVWDWYASRGRFINSDDEARRERICVIGPTVLRELFGNENPIGKHIRIAGVPFEIVGLMEHRGTSPGGGDMDNRIFVPLSTYLRRIANVDYLAGIKIRLDNADYIKPATASIRNLLRERHSLAPGEPDDFRVISPTEITRLAGSVAGTFNIFLVLIAGVSLIAGGFVIANIMVISVSKRRSEIGLRKAIGARRKNISFQFMLETVAVTLTGGVAGVLVGFLGAIVFRSVTDTPVSISWESVLVGLVFSTLVGLIASIQPARRAAGMQPVEALRS